MLPLEGPLCYVALAVTDKREEEFEFYATAHTKGIAGSPLAGGGTNWCMAILDSGAATHLLNYPDSTALGMQGAYLTANTFTVGGAGGSAEAIVSRPAGFFLHGLQDLAGQTVQSNRMVGLANFACGVLPEGATTNDIPSLLGAPMLAFFPAYIRNSQPVHFALGGQTLSSPSVTLYAADGTNVPTLAHRAYLEIRPQTQPLVAYLALLDADPVFPSMIGLSGSLFFTANQVTLSQGTSSARDRMLVDTGAQATLISRIAALDLGLDVQHPDFEVDVGGIGGTVTAPGFYLDRIQLPAEGGSLAWTNVPVVVLNLGSPESGVLFGILGSNLLRDRDLVFNGAAQFPYLDVSDPLILPELRITCVRALPAAEVQLDWWNEPAPGGLVLMAADELWPTGAAWTPLATARLSTIRGTFSVTNADAQRFFRLWAP